MAADPYQKKQGTLSRWRETVQTRYLWTFLFVVTLALGPSVCSHYARAFLLQESESLSACVSCIVKESKDREAIILGERHHRPQSQRLMLALVRELLDRGERLFVGLEIPADRQEDLERALAGQRPSKPLAPIVTDHAAYDQMLTELGNMVASGHRITVAAIDAASSQKNRDGAMYEKVIAALETGQYDRALVLVGNGHALKNMKWDPEVPRTNLPKLAKRLARDVEIYSVHQAFGEGQDGPCFMSTRTPKGALLAMRNVGILKHTPGMRGEDIADAVVLWGDWTAD